jgi:hypothetical protein
VRTSFLLSSPRLVDAPAVTPDVAELYGIDLDRMEIERVTRAYDGSEVNGTTADWPSVSGDGHRIAFVSGATNLLLGDANSATDAFVATRQAQTGSGQLDEPPFDQPSLGSPSGPGDEAPFGPSLRVSVGHAGTGVRVAVRVPGPGIVKALAQSRAGRKSGSADGPLRTVATARVIVDRAGRVTLVLHPSKRYLSVLHRKKRFSAKLEVRFAPKAGGRTLKSTRTVAFTLPRGG